MSGDPCVYANRGYFLCFSWAASSPSDLWTACSEDGSDFEMAFINESVSWLFAEETCQQNLGHLATVRNSSQIECAMEALSKSSDEDCSNITCGDISVGILRINGSRENRWIASRNLAENSSSLIWLPGQGTGVGCGFLRLNPTPQIGIDSCFAQRGFICQRNRQPSKGVIIRRLRKSFA